MNIIEMATVNARSQMTVDVVACTRNPATFEAKFQKGVIQYQSGVTILQ